ncbi:MAG: manganese efflux pump [Firmicutes bacterium]|nr:manganese efflux pump [Bacillota bacterium]
MNTYDILFASFVLLIVVSIDIFMVGFSYGANKTKIGWRRLTLVSLIGNIILGSALIFGYFIVRYIQEDAITWTVFTIFMLVGVIKLCCWMASNALEQETKTRTQNWKETFLLATILAIDGIGIGFATGLDKMTLPFMFIIISISFVFDIFLFKFGEYIGNKLATKTKYNLGWVNGAMFIALAILNIFI